MPGPYELSTGYAEQAPPQRDPCWTHLGRLAADLREFGVPPGMHRVGALEGVEVGSRFIPFNEDLPALLAGVGEAHTSLPEGDDSIEIARTLLMKILASAPAGAVSVSVYDGEMSGAFGDFSQLGPGRFNLVPPGGIRGLLDDLSTHVTKLKNSQTVAGTPAEPWRVAVLLGAEGEMGAREQDQLNKLIANGADWGSIIALGMDLAPSPWLREGWPEGFRVRPDAPIAGEAIHEQMRAISLEAEKGMAPPPLESVILPGEMWTHSAINGLKVPLGLNPATGEPLNVTIGDEHPHVIITGQSGSGKSLTIKTIMMGAAQNYSPREFEVSILDYKEGTEFANMAANSLDPSWLPNAKLVGANVNADPEFGTNALRDLQMELTRRAKRARELNVSNYMDLRSRDPEGHWPRKVMVIDEFQVLLQGPGGAQALEMLIDLARRGRAFGIHLVLASQNTSGIQELYAQHDALFKNFPLRLAGREGTLFDQFNNSPAALPRLHMVVNTNSGRPNYDTVVRIAAAFPDAVEGLQREIWRHREASSEPPRVFDANTVPMLAESRDYQRLKPLRAAEPKVLVAEEFSVKGGSAAFPLARSPGRNFAVVGQRTHEVGSVMGTAARSLAKQVIPEKGVFSLVCLDTQHAQTIKKLAEDLSSEGREVNVIAPHEARGFFARTRACIGEETDASHFVFVYGGDSGGVNMTGKSKVRTAVSIPEGHNLRVTDGARVMSGNSLAGTGPTSGLNTISSPATGIFRVKDGEYFIESEGATGQEELRYLFNNGPENGVHVIASFSGPERMRDVMGGNGAKVDGVGGYVTLGIPDPQMNAFTPGAPMAMNAAPVRPGRGRFYDRNSSAARRTVIPYRDPSVVDPDEDEDDY